VSFALLSVFPYFGRINNPNENARIWMVKAIVDNHELSINRVCDRWGYVNDKAIFEGRLYSSKAPGASFAGVPIYFVQSRLSSFFGKGEVSQRSMTLALRLFCVGLPLSFFAFFFARYVERRTGSSYARDLLTLALGLGTMLYPYGVLFVGHALSAALAFASFVVSSEARTRKRLVGAGVLAGLAVFFEYQVIFATALLTLHVALQHRRRATYFLLGALFPAVLLGAYHAALFGHPWDFPLGHLENPEWAKLHNGAQAFGLHLPSPRVAATILFSADVGLFAFSPVLAVGLASALSALVRLRRQSDTWLPVGIFVAMVAFLAGVPNWRSGWCVGPRYIVVVAPFLMAEIGRSWPFGQGRWAQARWAQGRWAQARWAPAWQAMVAGLAVASILLNVVSGTMYPHYPEAFDNPVFDLAWPLIKEGFVPYSLGWWLRLPGRASLLPIGLATLAALSLCLRGETSWTGRRRAWHGLAALTVSAMFLVPLGLYGRAPRLDEQRAMAIVKTLWEPPLPAPQPREQPHRW